MYSPRARWRRAAGDSALLRWESRSLRQATYSGEPAFTLLARQNASSSPPPAVSVVGSPRSRQPASSGATSNKAMQNRAALVRMQKSIRFQFRHARARAPTGPAPGAARWQAPRVPTLGDPAIHRKQGGFLKVMEGRVKPGHDKWSAGA